MNHTATKLVFSYKTEVTKNKRFSQTKYLNMKLQKETSQQKQTIAMHK